METAWLTGRSVKHREEEMLEGGTAMPEENALQNEQPHEITAANLTGPERSSHGS